MKAAVFVVALLALGAVHAAPSKKGKARNECTAPQTLNNCETGDSQISGLCYYCNPQLRTVAGTSQNGNFNLNLCKQQASAYLKKALTCQKQTTNQLQCAAYTQGCGVPFVATGTFAPTGAGIFGGCSLGVDTCKTACYVCNPSDPCFNIELCKASISHTIGIANLYTTDGCICTQAYQTAAPAP